MKTDLPKSTKDLKPLVVRKTARILRDNPDLMSEFIISSVRCSHTKLLKDWRPYKIALGRLANESARGHATPIKNRGSASRREQTKLFRQHDKNSVGYIPQIPLQNCKTDEEKVKMILESGMSKELKMEFLQDYIDL